MTSDAAQQQLQWTRWRRWSNENPQMVSLAAGAYAGMMSEALLFPLDCLKTRLQSRRGFVQSGGFQGIYRGVGVAMGGSIPSSAIFFSTYEYTKHSLAPYDHRHSALSHCSIGLIASICGELAAGVVRVPVDLVKQRQQAGHGKRFMDIARGVRSTHSTVFFASFQMSFMRDVMHSSLQFPLYEYLKLVTARCFWAGRDDLLPTWQAAVCGSIAGVISAFFTTPLDLLRTRLNLRGGLPTDADCLEQINKIKSLNSSRALILDEIQHTYRKGGARGFFAGATCRASWMGLGGFIFLGSFEFAKKNLLQEARLPRQTDLINDGYEEEGQELGKQRRLGTEPPASVSFLCGLLAGLAVDVPLHPLDTIKTRLQCRDGFIEAGGFRRVWNGLSAVLLVSVPGSAFFFVIYEYTRHFLERHVGGSQGIGSDALAVGRDAMAASIADVGACVVRVPCEVLKQRMQAIGPSNPTLTFRDTVRSVSAQGVQGFFAGFGAMALREVPFALIQMPLYEELKHRHPQAAVARETGDTQLSGLIGMQSGACAGAFAGFITTPLDTAKTQIILTENPLERFGIMQTMKVIWGEHGVRGLFRGVVPRTLQTGVGGALWLGAFEWSKSFLWGA